ncbi:MAG TPA: hypothetical protein VN581_08765 [Patescibacteria group bacterium]|nr:hypothetical protein [Patescibacteria group bacterium]
MHPVALLIVHWAIFSGGLVLALFGLMFGTGPGVQAGERAILGLLAIGLVGAVATVVSLHLRLPADYGVAAKIALDLLCLIGTAAIFLLLGFVALVVFNR